MVAGNAPKSSSEDKKLCPLRSVLGAAMPCERERCAWWRGKGCAVPEIAWWLSELWTALPSVKEEGGTDNGE